MIGRLVRWTTALAAAWACLGAGAAWARQSTDPIPPGTFVAGPIRLTPSLAVKDMGVDDNVFNEADNPKHDFTFTVTPRADVVFRMRRLRIVAMTSTDYVYYRTYRSERGTNVTSQARAEYDLGNLKPYATIQGANTRARLNTEVDTRARHRDLLYGAGLALKVASRTNLLADVSQLTTVFDPDSVFRGIDLDRSFDGRKRTVDGGVAFALTPLTTVSVLVARERQRFDLTPDRNSDTWRLSPTVTFSPTGLITGSASVGYRHFHTLSGDAPDYSGLVSAVTIGATIYARNQLQANFNRDVQY
jgi:hypothetical protein